MKNAKRIISMLVVCILTLTSLGVYASEAEAVPIYAPDGRCVWVWDYEVPTYVSVGWYEAVTLFDITGERSITVSPFEVDAYLNVGWYTYEGLLYQTLVSLCEENFQTYGFEEAIATVDHYEDIFDGTGYEYSVDLIRAQYMDGWRNSTKCPVGIADYSVQVTDDVRNAAVGFRNISYKTIDCIEFTASCYDANGRYLGSSEYDYFTADYADLDSGCYAQYYWNLDVYTGTRRAASFGNIRITKVVYSDGTSWSR